MNGLLLGFHAGLRGLSARRGITGEANGLLPQPVLCWVTWGHEGEGYAQSWLKGLSGRKHFLNALFVAFHFRLRSETHALNCRKVQKLVHCFSLCYTSEARQIQEMVYRDPHCFPKPVPWASGQLWELVMSSSTLDASQRVAAP